MDFTYLIEKHDLDAQTLTVTLSCSELQTPANQLTTQIPLELVLANTSTKVKQMLQIRCEEVIRGVLKKQRMDFSAFDKFWNENKHQEKTAIFELLTEPEYIKILTEANKTPEIQMPYLVDINKQVYLIKS